MSIIHPKIRTIRIPTAILAEPTITHLRPRRAAIRAQRDDVAAAALGVGAGVGFAGLAGRRREDGEFFFGADDRDVVDYEGEETFEEVVEGR